MTFHPPPFTSLFVSSAYPPQYPRHLHPAAASHSKGGSGSTFFGKPRCLPHLSLTCGLPGLAPSGSSSPAPPLPCHFLLSVLILARQMSKCPKIKVFAWNTIGGIGRREEVDLESSLVERGTYGSGTGPTMIGIQAVASVAG